MDNALLATYVFGAVDSMILYYYFCRLTGVKYRPYLGALYTALVFGIIFAVGYERMAKVPYMNMVEMVGLMVGIAILFHKRGFTESLVAAFLIHAIDSIVFGIVYSVGFWVVSMQSTVTLVFSYMDIVQGLCDIALEVTMFCVVCRFFGNDVRNPHTLVLPVLLVPILFILLFGVFLLDSVYGRELTIQTGRGVIAPQVNSFQIVLLRLFALAGLFSALLGYKKLVTAIAYEKQVNILEQQTQNQATYVAEAILRYESTRSFRHDVRNHYLVLGKLLTDGSIGEARAYLAKLENVSDTLSFNVHTGNVAVDALLGSKLAIAAEQGIMLNCDLHIPKTESIHDMDWCIVLANAVDNAMNASKSVAEQGKKIHLYDSRKGNVYLLTIENGCAENTDYPIFGIGLSNIKAVLEKYEGRIEIEIAEDIFKLNALFIIPQQNEVVSQQNH